MSILASDEPTKSSRYEFREVPFSEVVGVDDAMLDMLKEANLTPFLPVDHHLWKSEALGRFLDDHPFVVRDSSKGYFCIGGFRRFRLAQAIFSDNPGYKVNVLVRLGKLSLSERMRLIGQEFLLAPAVERAARSDAANYYGLWSRLGEGYSPIVGKREGDFDRAMGFLPRNKKKNPVV